MSKVDTERYLKEAAVIGIKGYPKNLCLSLLLFVNGSSQAYTGGFCS